MDNLKPPTQPLEVAIDGLPPSANMIWRRAGARFYKTREANQWDIQAQNKVSAKAFWVFGKSDLSAFVGLPVSLEIDVCRPTWRGKTKAKKHLYVRPDLDNYCKSCIDAVFSALKLDDCAVVEMHVRKIESPNERTVVRLKFIEDPNATK